MRKIFFVFKLTAALCAMLFAVSSFSGPASTGPVQSGGAKFISHGQAAQKEESGAMAWVKEKAGEYLPEGAMNALNSAGSRIEGVGGLAGVLSLAIPEESWAVFSNLDDLL